MKIRVKTWEEILALSKPCRWHRSPPTLEDNIEVDNRYFSKSYYKDLLGTIQENPKPCPYFKNTFVIDEVDLTKSTYEVI